MVLARSEPFLNMCRREKRQAMCQAERAPLPLLGCSSMQAGPAWAIWAGSGAQAS